MVGLQFHSCKVKGAPAAALKLYIFFQLLSALYSTSCISSLKADLVVKVPLLVGRQKMASLLLVGNFLPVDNAVIPQTSQHPPSLGTHEMGYSTNFLEEDGQDIH